jgi:hypothetical protein
MHMLLAAATGSSSINHAGCMHEWPMRCLDRQEHAGCKCGCAHKSPPNQRNKTNLSQPVARKVLHGRRLQKAPKGMQSPMQSPHACVGTAPTVAAAPAMRLSHTLGQQSHKHTTHKNAPPQQPTQAGHQMAKSAALSCGFAGAASGRWPRQQPGW